MRGFFCVLRGAHRVGENEWPDFERRIVFFECERCGARATATITVRDDSSVWALPDGWRWR